MRDANGRIGGVHGLSARAGGAEGVNTQILGFNFDVDIFRFGENGDSRRRCVDATLLLGGRDALDAMHSAFIFQLRINFLALNRRYHFFHSADR